ncbi:MAG: hypothetical protein H6620_09810 [Halobacteriovoraceae bacterium]|nr:hypothetical protein [Halobacteriovoraceae bacterium]
MECLKNVATKLGIKINGFHHQVDEPLTLKEWKGIYSVEALQKIFYKEQDLNQWVFSQIKDLKRVPIDTTKEGEYEQVGDQIVAIARISPKVRNVYMKFKNDFPEGLRTYLTLKLVMHVNYV